MKNKFKIIIALSVSLITVSCGGEKEDKNDSGEELSKLDKETKGLINNIEQLSETLNAESEGGEPIHYTDLQKYLPRNVEGYNMEDPEGTTLSMEGFSVSSAEAEYTSENGNYMRVSIMDYNAAQSLFKMSTGMWDMGIIIDSDEEYAKSFSLNENINGWETFDKKNNKATVIAGVGDRLMISVEANNQTNVEKVKEVLASMNIKSMIIVTNKTK